MGKVSNERAAKYRWQVYDLASAGLSPVAFSGNYSDLINLPIIPAAQVNSDWNATTGMAVILNKPTLFSGAYTDLTGKPTIPAAQVNSDWNSTTGVSVILNKPSIPTTTTQVAEGTNLYYTNARVASYVSSLGLRKTETFLGTTGTGGTLTTTFPTAYTTIPHVTAQVVGGNAAMMLTITSVSLTGCTVSVVQRSAVTLLGLEVLLAATVAVVGASVSINVVSRT